MPVSDLKNLGAVSARWLESVDIHTVGDLRRLGPALAWRIVRERYPEANVLLLWAMAAGLMDRHWQSLSESEKKALRAEAESIRFGDATVRLPMVLLPVALLLAALFAAPSAAAQNLPFSPLVEAQIYPAGGILVGGVRLGPLDVHAGWNLTRRGDFGEHDNERGGGPGIGLGIWQRGAPGLPGAASGLLGVAGLRAGLRLDVWYLDIDWWDRVPGGITGPPTPPRRSGSTQITVVQPTLRLRFDLPGTPLGLTAAVGAEFNVSTDGEDVGEGAIGLLGLRWAF